MTICLKHDCHDGKIHFFPFNDILWVQAFDYYVKIHINGRFYLVREHLKKMETTLPGDMFLRTHKSSPVSIAAIRKLTPHFNNAYIVTLFNGKKPKIIQSYRENLKDLLDFSQKQSHPTPPTTHTHPQTHPHTQTQTQFGRYFSGIGFFSFSDSQ